MVAVWEAEEAADTGGEGRAEQVRMHACQKLNNFPRKCSMVKTMFSCDVL